MKKNLAIIVPVFNLELLIEKNIKHAINIQEKLPSIKYYFVDDCSTDESWKILTKYKSKIKVYRSKKNIGLAGARKIGLKKALNDVKNTHFNFLDGDDRHYYNTIKLWQDNQLFNKISMYSFSRSLNPPIENSIKFKNVLLFKNDIFFVAHSLPIWLFIIPRKKINLFSLPLQKKYFHEDVPIVTPLIIHNYNKINFIEKPLVYNYMHSNSITGMIHNKYSRDRFKALEDLRKIASSRDDLIAFSYLTLIEIQTHLHNCIFNKYFNFYNEVKFSLAFLEKHYKKNDIKIALKLCKKFRRIVFWILIHKLSFIYKSIVIIRKLFIK